MIRRFSAIAAAALLAVLSPVASYPAIAATPLDLGAFQGTWTPDTSSGSLLTGHDFGIQLISASSEGFVGADEQADFERYCDPTVADNITYFQVAYTWAPGPTTAGGCHSSKTGPHIYFWGSHEEVGYVHQATVSGEDVLKGEWGQYDSQGTLHNYTFTAHRPDVLFHAKGSRRTFVRNSDHIYRQVELHALGDVRLLSRPQEDCAEIKAADGEGAVSFKLTKVGQNTVDLYDVALDIPGSLSTEVVDCSSNQTALSHLPVVVSKSDPTEKDPCPEKARGFIDLYDAGTTAQHDTFALHVPACHISVTLSTKNTSDKVAVAMSINKNGY